MEGKEKEKQNGLKKKKIWSRPTSNMTLRNSGRDA